MVSRIPYLDEHPLAPQALARSQVLYTDLDGTLVAKGGSVLANAEGTPSICVAEAIVSLSTAGLDVVPVSGRNRLQLRELTQLLGWSAYIAEAGGLVAHGTGLDADVHLDCGEWPDGTLDAGVTPFDAIVQSGAYEVLTSAFPGRIEHYAPWQLDREVSLLLRGCLDMAEAQRALDSVEPPVDLVDNGMLRSYGGLTCRDMPPHAYHVVPRGVSKTRAISIDLERRGLTREQAIAIGDSATDLAMADAVGMMVLVANAFASPGVTSELDGTPRGNVAATHAERGEGWAELANAWLAAKTG